MSVTAVPIESAGAVAAGRREVRRELLRELLRSPLFIVGSLILLWWIVCGNVGAARAPHAPHAGRVAVVAPAGNEQSTRRYWPAAHPEVIGVASTNRRGNGRAWFSNWGDWCDCCARGDYVYSTFVHWDGPVEGESPDEIEHFRGWARWDGTSFAAPKVSAQIAAEFAASDRATPPAEVAKQLIAARRSSAVTDEALSGAPGVALPYLQTR